MIATLVVGVTPGGAKKDTGTAGSRLLMTPSWRPGKILMAKKSCLWVLRLI